jgi:phage gp46-like protein
MIALAFNNAAQSADLLRQPDGPYVDDPGLETAVTISLFTDAHDVKPPAPGQQRRGWWADAYPTDANDSPIGSRLWTRRRSVLSTEVLQEMQDDAEEALAWLVADGVASDVTATATAVTKTACLLAVEIERPNNPQAWKKVWLVPNAVQ